MSGVVPDVPPEFARFQRLVPFSSRSPEMPLTAFVEAAMAWALQDIGAEYALTTSPDRLGPTRYLRTFAYIRTSDDPLVAVPLEDADAMVVTVTFQVPRPAVPE